PGSPLHPVGRLDLAHLLRPAGPVRRRHQVVPRGLPTLLRLRPVLRQHLADPPAPACLQRPEGLAARPTRTAPTRWVVRWGCCLGCCPPKRAKWSFRNEPGRLLDTAHRLTNR